MGSYRRRSCRCVGCLGLNIVKRFPSIRLLRSLGMLLFWFVVSLNGGVLFGSFLFLDTIALIFLVF